jgi:lipoprotein-releasing system permease protein
VRNYFPSMVGIRFFTSGSANRLASFISTLAIGGLVLGIAMLIVVLSVMNGFEREMRVRILGVIPHIQLFAEHGVVDWQSAARQIAQHPEVSTVVPFTQVEGIIGFRGRTQALQLRGSEAFGSKPEQMHKVNEILPDASGLDDNKILLSRLLAEKLGIHPGQKIAFIAPRAGEPGESFRRSEALPQIRIFEVAQLFATHTTLDARLGIVSMAAANDLAGLKSNDIGLVAQGLKVSVVDVFAARKIAYELLDNLPSSYSFVDWIQTHGNLYQAIQMSRKMVGLLVFLIIAIAVFNVVAMLVMTVVNKRADIAILKTQGASAGQILTAFLVQGSMIGLFGSFLGVVLGCLGAWFVADVVVWLESVLQLRFLNLNIYPIDYVPSDLRLNDIIKIVFVALSLNLLVMLYPAWKAARVKPALILRHE